MKKKIIFVLLLLKCAVYAEMNLKLTLPQPLEIKDSAVSDEYRARRIATGAYLKKMSCRMSATWHWEISIIKAECDVAGFCIKNEQVWEARLNGDGMLMAIIWIHPDTAKAHFVHITQAEKDAVEQEIPSLRELECAEKPELSGATISNRALKVEGFMKRTKIVQTNAAVAAKLSIAKDKMRVLRKPRDAQVDTGKGPQTLD